MKLTTDKAYAQKCDDKIIYVDYVNITKVVSVNSRVFVDDGFISLLVKEIGKIPEWLAAYDVLLKLLCCR